MSKIHAIGHVGKTMLKKDVPCTLPQNCCGNVCISNNRFNTYRYVVCQNYLVI